MQHSISGGLKTSCADLPLSFAAVLLLLLGLSMVGSVAALPAAQAIMAAHVAATPKTTDLALYKSIATQVREGRSYYTAATETQRKEGYPVRPFFTVRMPTLTWTIALISSHGARLLIVLLAAATVAAWGVWLATILSPSVAWGAGVLAIGLGVLPATLEPSVWFTEAWAGVLIALSLALRRPDRWWPSVAVALAAVLIRELALLYLIAMGTSAALAGRRREALGWGMAIGIFALVFFWHAQAILALIRPGDPVSPGWSGHGGWAMFIAASRELTTLTALPPIAVAALLPFCYFGLAASNTAVGLRALITLTIFTLLLVVFARPDNHYWIWMIGPILFLGLMFAPFGVADLVNSIRRRDHSNAKRAAED
jgi:hypothetical protein